MKLKEIYKKGMKTSNKGFLHHTLYVVLASPFVKLFAKLKVKPNYVSIISLLLGLASLYFYFIFVRVPAVLLWELSLVLGYCDGILARVTNRCSEFGRFIDTMSDHFVQKLFPVVLALGLYFFYEEINILIIAFILYAFVRLREVVGILSERNEMQKKMFSKRREEVKSRFSIFAGVFMAVINFNKVAFPFVILFNLKIIFAFYFFNMFVELLRIIFDYYSTFYGLIKKQ